MSKQSQLNEIAAEITQCVKCPLANSRNNTVPGSGNPEADILFVGEAPGQKEDEQGIPFCGAAGKFLDEMLYTIGLSRDQVFIANTLKCRPPENRDPEDSEKQACRPYLDKQVEVIKPKLIVCLGRHSVANFMPGAGGISKLHGKAVRRPNGQVYLALYHPAAALHNGGLRSTLIEDFKKIPAILNKIIKSENQKEIKTKDTEKQKEKEIQQKLL
ncbi:MAG: Uracil DNA glycosylase superfamily protein [bacterium ADurb.Bin212]|nr:MAG: Uracil DNA glycosylase superfamily protein [bacterium ADurb.Bin212]